MIGAECIGAESVYRGGFVIQGRNSEYMNCGASNNIHLEILYFGSWVLMNRLIQQTKPDTSNFMADQ